MKIHTVVLGFIAFLMLGFAGFYYLGGALLADVHVETASAADFPDAFESVRALLEGSGAPRVFDDAPLGDAARYRFVSVTVDLYNRGIFDADWLSVTLEPFPGDIAVYALSGEGDDIAAGRGGQVSLRLITTAPADAQRSVTIEYHVFGMKRSITVK